MKKAKPKGRPPKKNHTVDGESFICQPNAPEGSCFWCNLTRWGKDNQCERYGKAMCQDSAYIFTLKPRKVKVTISEGTYTLLVDHSPTPNDAPDPCDVCLLGHERCPDDINDVCAALSGTRRDCRCILFPKKEKAK